MPKRYPQELKKQAGGLYDDSRTYREVASALGVGAMTVWRWVREIGIPTRSASEAATLSPKVKLAQEKSIALLKRTYCGSERHLANLAKLVKGGGFKIRSRRGSQVRILAHASF